MRIVCLLSLAACSTGAPSPSPVDPSPAGPEPAEPSALEAPPTSPAVPPPPDDVAAAPLRSVPRLAPGPGARPAIGLPGRGPRVAAPTHCTPEETAWLTCGIDGDRALSLCGQADGTGTVYRFGPVGAPALVYPAEGAVGVFRHTEELRDHGVTNTVWFTVDDYRYEVTTAVDKPPGERLSTFQGVRVYRSTDEVPATELRCQAPVQGRSVATLGALLDRG